MNLVARAVSKSEYSRSEEATGAILKEWTKLREAGCWREDKVQEWADVKRRAQQNGEEVHVGSLHELCMEKGSELPPDHEDRKFKGRVVFLGDRVRDAYGHAAVFDELSSSPAAMEAGKFCDSYGLLPGHCTKQADAKQAYIQTNLKGKQTWVRIPAHRQPPGWEKFRDPVCPLILALYGHPDSGGYWENTAKRSLVPRGSHPLADVSNGAAVFGIRFLNAFWSSTLMISRSLVPRPTSTSASLSFSKAYT